jgi:hypothetical protein
MGPVGICTRIRRPSEFAAFQDRVAGTMSEEADCIQDASELDLDSRLLKCKLDRRQEHRGITHRAVFSIHHPLHDPFLLHCHCLQDLKADILGYIRNSNAARDLGFDQSGLELVWPALLDRRDGDQSCLVFWPRNSGRGSAAVRLARISSEEEHGASAFSRGVSQALDSAAPDDAENLLELEIGRQIGKDHSAQVLP